MGIELEAAELAFALEWGYISLSDVTAWADKEIENSDQPNLEIIDIAFSKNPSDVLTLLRKFSKDINEWKVIKLFFQRFENIETLNYKDASKLSRFLFLLAINRNDCPDDMIIFHHHSDNIDLAKQGVINCTPEQAISEFLSDIKSIIINT